MSERDMHFLNLFSVNSWIVKTMQNKSFGTYLKKMNYWIKILELE